jgi:hypothetical protein
MKRLFLSISFFCVVNLFSQSDKKIYLNTLNDSLMESIIKQGKCLFKKSDCIKSNIDDYFIIPDFLVQSKIPLQELKFSSKDSLLSNLYTVRKSTKKLLVNFGWTVIDKNNMNFADSDWKRFYCYNKFEYSFEYLKFVNDHLGLINVKYTFGISGVDGFLEFIVAKNEQVFIYYSKDKKWMNLSQFDDFYRSGKIKKFDNDPFK